SPKSYCKPPNMARRLDTAPSIGALPAKASLVAVDVHPKHAKDIDYEKYQDTNCKGIKESFLYA
ncbi:MAG TPA: hypothetical protein VFI70_09830, partial [Nitrososphaeraceae archaeon]|nr:hypothetical protein [Nitrososphaeraceae archaeon]